MWYLHARYIWSSDYSFVFFCSFKQIITVIIKRTRSTQRIITQTTRGWEIRSRLDVFNFKITRVRMIDEEVSNRTEQCKKITITDTRRVLSAYDSKKDRRRCSFFGSRTHVARSPANISSAVPYILKS